MHHRSFVNQGVITRLPPGFRFKPTDEELVFQYLKCKIFSLPLHASVIPELHHFSKFDPWDLPGDPEEERYFFTKKEAKYRSGNQANRATRTRFGYWKATGGFDKQITPPQTEILGQQVMMGLKKTLVFHKGKSPNGCRTNWIMHEYSLVLNHTLKSTHHQSCEATPTMENWVIFRIFLKKKIEEDVDDLSRLDGCAFLNSDLTYSCCSSSSSSCSISDYEISSNELECEEEVSCSF